MRCFLHICLLQWGCKVCDMDGIRIYLFKLTFIGVQLLYNVVLVSTVQQSELTLCIKPVQPKRNQSWIFSGRTKVEAETPILWPPDVKNWLIRKDADTGKDWRQKEKEMTENEMVGWHHQLNGHEFKASSGSWWWTGKPGVLQSTGSLSRTWLSGWTEPIHLSSLFWISFPFRSPQSTNQRYADCGPRTKSVHTSVLVNRGLLPHAGQTRLFIYVLSMTAFVLQ